MARKPLRLANTLFLVFLLAMEASGRFLSLANFQSISSESLPLGCVIAYNAPIQGCSRKDFENGNTCSAACQNGITRVESNIQSSCVLVSIGSSSLLDQAQNGNLLIALCGNRQAPPPPTTSISFPPPRTFSRIPFDTPPPTSTTTTSISTSVAPSTPSPTSTTTRNDDGDGDWSLTSSTITTPIATTSKTQKTNTEAQVPTTSTETTSSTAPPAPRRTQPPGGGGSPFDFVPESASQKSIDVPARILALLVFTIAVNMA